MTPNECRRGHRAGVDERARRELDTKVQPLEGTRSEQDEVARLTEYDFIDGSLSNDVKERRSDPPLVRRDTLARFAEER